MVPVPITSRNSHSTRFLYILFSVSSKYVLHFIRRTFGDASDDFSPHFLLKRDEVADRSSTKFIVFASLIPVLVLLSGLFAGLTLGYMSLDVTQLNVLSISGTPEQRKYAKKIIPVRKNGHLLLVTLLLANMIVNESLPVIADPVLGGGIQGVIVSTALIVIFAEIIPQSLFTRHGLYLGAKMAWFARILIYGLGILSWPVAKLLELVLGPHHGIIYRRAELKELIAMHASHGMYGGDLKTDTVTIIGATLDLQEKVVKQAMTPIENVFMLSIDSKLDYNLLKQICQTGHSRVPVYEEVEVPMGTVLGPEDSAYYENKGQRTVRVKKIIGILLVKQCVLLDPKDATPLRKIPLNKVPFVPSNEPLLGILDKFQEGGSHMAIVSRFSVEKAASMKKAVKRGLTQRLRARVRLGDADSDTESSEEEGKAFSANQKRRRRDKSTDAHRSKEFNESNEIVAQVPSTDRIEDGMVAVSDEEKKIVLADTMVHEKTENEESTKKEERRKSKTYSFQFPKLAAGMTSMSVLEQSMPADAVLTKESAAEFLQSWDPAVMPLGIITLEDVLEELIGEEIYDEFDKQGAHGHPHGVPPIYIQEVKEDKLSPAPDGVSVRPESREGSQGRKGGLKTIGFFRASSAPPVARTIEGTTSNTEGTGDGVSNATATANVGKTERDGNLTILMPRPLTFGHNPPSTIEQNSSISSTETGVSGTLVGAESSNVAGGGRPAAARSLSVNLTSETSGLKSLALNLVPPAVTTPIPTLEAILLDRKRRLVGSGSSSSTASSNPVSYPPIIYKDFAFSSNTARTPSPSDSLSAPGALKSGVVGTIGKGTKFKSSPLGGGSRTRDVVAERVGAAYSPSPHQSEEVKDNEGAEGY